MGEVEGLALGNEGRNFGPRLGLRSVAEQVHYDCAFLDGLLDREESLAGDLTETSI